VRNRELECRSRVVVKPAHKSRIYPISNTTSIERSEDLSKVLPTCIIQKVRDLRQRVDDLLISCILRVEDTQRIRLRPALIIRAHPRLHRSQSLTQRRNITRPISRRPNRVQLQLPALHTKLVQEGRKHLQ